MMMTLMSVNDQLESSDSFFVLARYVHLILFFLFVCDFSIQIVRHETHNDNA
jgi:hypothetical protein